VARIQRLDHARIGGRGHYWIGSESGPSVFDAALFYFIDVVARAFIDRFACDVVVQGEWPLP
jgi:hypothetical protein